MKKVSLIMIILYIAITNYSQQSISLNGSPPDPSAVLDVISHEKGMLIPSLTNEQRYSLSNPAEGLLIFNTESKMFNYWDGTSWMEIPGSDVIVTQAGVVGSISGVLYSVIDSLPHHSAILEVKGFDGGILIPRMSTTQRDAIINPANGLVIYNTTTHCFNYYDVTINQWIGLSGNSVGNTTGSTTASFGIAINQDGSEAHPSALLDIKSTDKGLLIPRLTTAQRDAIPSPAIGLCIYNLDTKSFQIYKAQDMWLDVGLRPQAYPAADTTAASFTAMWSFPLGNYNGFYIDVATCSNFTGCYVSGYHNLDVGNVTSYNVIGLNCNTPYYYRIRAYNSCGSSGNSNIITVETKTCPGCGSQVWMSANMNVGAMINDPAEQNNDSQIEKYCYNNNPANCTTYGGLYQWAEAIYAPYSANNNNFTGGWTDCDPCGDNSRQGICPGGYHVPTDLEFSRYEWCVENTISPVDSTTLYDFQTIMYYRGSNTVAGPCHKMKVKNSYNPAWDGSNASGFSAVPAGVRFYTGGFNSISSETHFWTATESATDIAWEHNFYTGIFQSFRSANLKTFGLSVRCLQN